MLPFQTENEKRKPRRIFLDLFTICSSCKWKIVVCLFVDKETNKTYLFANRLNGHPIYAY